MTATNHALTGAAIGLLIMNPVIALPLAFVSHFVCDALPHFGATHKGVSWLKSRRFHTLLLCDALGCLIVVACLAWFQPQHWAIAAIGAFLATSPDLFWIPRFIRGLHDKPWHPGLFSRFAARIQWFEKPIGAVAEFAWLVAGISIMAAFC